MTVARSVADVLDDHVVFEVESIDRMYLNVWQPRLAYGGGVQGFFVGHRGYHYASTALMDPMTKTFVADIHGFVASNVPARLQDMRSDAVAAHIVCGTISSRLGDHGNYIASLPDNPHIQFVDAQRHGYTRCTFTRDRASFEFRVVDDVRDPTSGLDTLAAFETEWGVAGLRRI